MPWLSNQSEWAFQCVTVSSLDDASLDGTCLLSMGGLYAINPLRSAGARSSQSISEAGAAAPARRWLWLGLQPRPGACCTRLVAGSVRACTAAFQAIQA